MNPAKLAIAAAPLAGLLIAAPASASPAVHWKHIGSCSAQGDYATCTAGGNVNYPRTIRVYVYATPRQQASGYWSVTCSKGNGAGSENGRFSGSASFYTTIKMPYRHPDSCSVGADAQLGTGGHIVVQIAAKK